VNHAGTHKPWTLIPTFSLMSRRMPMPMFQANFPTVSVRWLENTEAPRPSVKKGLV
jgi:hypothetical protein